MMFCLSCKCHPLCKKNIIVKILDQCLMSDIVNEVLSYLEFKQTYVLHLYYDTTNEIEAEPHYICNDCKDYLDNIRLICDTPFITCPGCKRVIYAG